MNWRASGAHSLSVAELDDLVEELELFDALEELDLLELEDDLDEELDDDLDDDELDDDELEELEELEELDELVELVELDETALDDEGGREEEGPEHWAAPAKATMAATATTAITAITGAGNPPRGGVGGVGGSGACPPSETVPTAEPQLWQNFAPSGSSAPQLLQYITPPFGKTTRSFYKKTAL